jgi:hypothetical protein
MRILKGLINLIGDLIVRKISFWVLIGKIKGISVRIL